MLYFSRNIIFSLHDIYHLLAQKYNISFKLIKEDFCILLSNYLEKSLDNLYNTKDKEKYLNNVLKELKSTYLNYKNNQLKYILSKKWNTYSINGKNITEDEVYDIIKQGNIYSISPYKEYIDMYIQNIYKKLNEQSYIELSRVNTDISSIINRYIAKSEIMIMLDLQSFNNNLINHLARKRKMYIENKLSPKSKSLVIKK